MYRRRLTGRAALISALAIATLAPAAWWAFADRHPAETVVRQEWPTQYGPSLPYWTPIEPDAFGGVVPLADGDQVPLYPNDLATPVDAQIVNTPRPLPRPRDAGRLPSAEATDETLRAIINQELPNVAEDDLQIWLEELRDFTPDVVRFLLRRRRRLGLNMPVNRLPDRSAASGWGMPEAPATNGNEFNAAAAASVSRRFLNNSLARLKQVCHVIASNVANSRTVGFRRSVPIVSGLSSQPVQSQEHVARTPRPNGMRLIETRTDQTPGTLERTGGTFDLAIDGPGFFAVRLGEDLLYTRRGNFVQDQSHALALQTGTGPAVLAASPKIPDDAVSIVVSADGSVRAQIGDGSRALQVGVIQLVCFPNPAELRKRSGELFAPTDLSGPARSVKAGSDEYGWIRQGALERSNVDLDRELDELNQIIRAIRALQDLIEPDHDGRIRGPAARS